MNTDALNGVIAVLVTPYANDTERLDLDVATRIAAQVDGGGVHVMTALGNTAEVQQLEALERRALVRAVAEGRSQSTLLAGVIGSVGVMLDDADFVRTVGYDAVMVHEPADPFGDGAGLAALYETFADRSPLPVVLYLRSARLHGRRLTDLVQHPNIVGVKYAKDDLGELTTILAADSPASCVWINGLAESRVPTFSAIGVVGFTSGIANVRPDAALAVHAASVAGDLNRLRQLMRLLGPIEAIRAEGNGRFNVAVLKAMLLRDGLDVGGVRAPHSPLSESAAVRLNAAMDAWDIAAFAVA